VPDKIKIPTVDFVFREGTGSVRVVANFSSQKVSSNVIQEERYYSISNALRPYSSHYVGESSQRKRNDELKRETASDYC
jgi:hypothetical protein